MRYLLIRERYKDSFLESPEEGGVKFPGTVGGTQEEDLVGQVRSVRPLHLLQQFRLDPAAVLLFPGTPLSADTVYLIDKDHLSTTGKGNHIVNILFTWSK